MTDYGTGWIKDLKDDRDYFLETAISKLTPQEIETEAKNIRLERALFAEDDDSPILRRAIRLVLEEEWKAKRKRVNQPSYLFLPLVKKKKHKKYLASLQNKDLFLPKSVDLRDWFSAITNQKGNPSCTAHAGVALMEYFQKRINRTLNKDASSINDNLSWSFLHKITRNLMESSVDFGATIRDTLKAMALFGIPPAKYWDGNKELDEEPSAFCYAYAQNYQATHYFRLDISESCKDMILVRIRIALASGFPSVFGFHDPNILKDYTKKYNPKESTENNQKSGQISVVRSNILNKNTEKEGHALVAVGYDDIMEFNNPDDPNQPLKGAFLVRNSWGEDWGDRGYGWLPYYYVEKGLATDWWSLLNAEWIDFSRLGLIIGNDGNLNLSCCNLSDENCNPNDC
ncbi:C1 family peptidase [Tumidithrix elongata RA019]|uniref:C1 family peptidase n=1 Tax=Tumidithrix elongata BACA0141 TaxID=2716417 RepID=A0AAW9Q3V0_9CYAN|nr:C1 family peptidase [Tumidithrix elongata RA019]